MAYSGTDEFQRRVSDIEERRAKFSSDAVQSFYSDGRKRRKSTRRKPLHVIGYTLVGFILFKLVLMTLIGPSAYNKRVDVLAHGNPAEQAGAWVMRVDPATKWFADEIRRAFWVMAN